MKITGKKIGHYASQGWSFCDYLDHKSDGHPMKKTDRRSYTKKIRNFLKKDTEKILNII